MKQNGHCLSPDAMNACISHPYFRQFNFKLYPNIRQIPMSPVIGIWIHVTVSTRIRSIILAFSRRISSCLSQELFSPIERPKLSFHLRTARLLLFRRAEIIKQEEQKSVKSEQNIIPIPEGTNRIIEGQTRRVAKYVHPISRPSGTRRGFLPPILCPGSIWLKVRNRSGRVSETHQIICQDRTEEDSSRSGIHFVEAHQFSI